MGFVAWIGDPKIARHLLREEHEVVVDEVRKHWFAYLRPGAEALLGLVLLVASPFIVVGLAGIALVVSFSLLLHAGWLALAAHRDRFVITNMRVFRLHGVLSQSLATMPLSRILDISVKKPLHGRVLVLGFIC